MCSKKKDMKILLYFHRLNMIDAIYMIITHNNMLLEPIICFEENIFSLCLIWPPRCVVRPSHWVVVSQPRVGTTTALGSIAYCYVSV